MEKILAEKGEGICVKDPDSRYLTGERREHWLKLKPDYFSELGEHCDCLVVGRF
jgi:DNA ligase-4